MFSMLGQPLSQKAVLGFGSHAQNKFSDISRNGMPPDLLKAFAVIPLRRDQFPMPSQNRTRSYDSGYLFEHFPPKNFAFVSQTPALLIVEQNTLSYRAFLGAHCSRHEGTQLHPAVYG
jgi:hypothetical protein